jgi:hypothetical protein
LSKGIFLADETLPAGQTYTLGSFGCQENVKDGVHLPRLDGRRDGPYNGTFPVTFPSHEVED